MSAQVLTFLQENFPEGINHQTYSFVLELYDYVSTQYHHPQDTSSDSEEWTDEESEDLEIEVDEEGYYSLT